MGQFSWITKQGEQITTESTVWMVFKFEDGRKVVVREDSYEGYGNFGGVDYYNALYLMNASKIRNFDYLDHPDQQREIGINLKYGNSELDVEGYIEFPQLFLHEPSLREIKLIDWFTECPVDPNQGWVDEECNFDEYDDDKYIYDHFSR